MVEAVPKGRDISQMFWAGVWLGGRTGLIQMEVDPAITSGYNAQSYIWALEKGLLPVYQLGLVFQQDNALIHTARITRS